MEKEVTKLFLDEMTQQKMYKIFGLRVVKKMKELEDWLNTPIKLTSTEELICNYYQGQLLDNINNWNEQELSLGFIGPILNLVKFKVPYKITFFAQRPVSVQIGNYELYGKPDGMLASGFHEPEVPYFSFQEFKKDVTSSGDPIGQNLAAMLVGQCLNEEKTPIYGCYVVGRLWYFMMLKEKEYAISKAYTADDDEIIDIVKKLKSLRDILFKKINYNITDE